MKERYIMIAVGGVFLLLAVAALVFSQMRPQSSTEVATNTTVSETIIPPTSAPAAETTGVSVGGITLTISSPPQNTIVTRPQILVRGKTTPNAEVFINDKDTIADESGNFSATLTLDEGENLIIVTANDADGNVAENEIVVTYEG